jgi:hypothetical protein
LGILEFHLKISVFETHRLLICSDIQILIAMAMRGGRCRHADEVIRQVRKRHSKRHASIDLAPSHHRKICRLEPVSDVTKSTKT